MFDWGGGVCVVVEDGRALTGAAAAARLAECSAEDLDPCWVPDDADAPPERDWPVVVGSPGEVLDRAVSLERVVCRAQAEQAEALVEFAECCPVTGPQDRGFGSRADISEFVVDELSCALSITRRAADMQLTLALQLVESLPGTLAAWRNGDLDVRRVRVIADGTAILTPEQATRVEARVLPKAAGKTTAQLGRLVDRVVIAIDPDAANARHEKARHDRHVQVRPGPDGMSILKAALSAEDAATLYATLSLIAHALPASDPRTMNQRRADTLLDLVTGHHPPPTAPPASGGGPDSSPPAAATGHSDSDAGTAARSTTGGPACTAKHDSTGAATRPTDPAPHPSNATPSSPDDAADAPVVSNYTGPYRSTEGDSSRRRPGKPLVQVVVTAGTLLGLDDTPAELAGYGPIPSDLARRIAADAVWHRILTDPTTGQVLDYGRTTYRPPAALVDHIRARDRVCRFPPCQTPAHQTDLDHKKRYRHGGTTRPDNLWTLCRHHHRLKDTPTGWKATGDPNDKITWTSPTGHTYHSYPHDYRNDHPPTPPPPEKPPTAKKPTPTTDEPPF